jgi:hypothetical protein
MPKSLRPKLRKRPKKPRKKAKSPWSPSDQDPVHSGDRDLEYARLLLEGFARSSKAIEHNEFPTETTTPTENECRAALTRVLLRDDPPKEIVRAHNAALDPARRRIGR